MSEIKKAARSGQKNEFRKQQEYHNSRGSQEYFIKTPVNLLFDKNLKPIEKLFLLYLIWRQGDNPDCWPSEETISGDLEVSERHVRRLSTKLKMAGYIDIIRPQKYVRGIGNHYIVRRTFCPPSAPFNEKEGGQGCPDKADKSVQRRRTGMSTENKHRKEPLKKTNSLCPNRVRTKQFSDTSIEFSLASYLLTKIIERKQDFKKPNLQSWARHIDLMLRQDKRDPEKIKDVIKWAQADGFWQNNILSTEKLRKQFDTLELRMDGNRKYGKQYTANRRNLAEAPASKFGATCEI